MAVESMQAEATSIAEVTSPWPEGHVHRVASYSVTLASAASLDVPTIEIIRQAALLHEIGKAGIPSSLLKKTDRLTAEEFELIKRHPVVGAAMCAALPTDAEAISAIVRSHHEHWNGEGYPDHLQGEEIPIGARIIAIVDAYDAMTTDRPYRKALDMNEVIRRLRAARGTQFDPDTLDAFLDLVISGRLVVPEYD